jgi:hypothetical protein
MNQSRRRSPKALALLAAALLAPACSASIEGANNSGGGSRPKGSGPTGTEPGTGDPVIGPDGKPVPPTGMGMGGAGGPTLTTGPIISTPTDSSRFARLSHKQWENTVRDLLRLTASPGISTSFVTEPLRGNFDNAGGFLQVAPGLWSDYQRAAEGLADSTVRDPKRLAAILPPALPADPAMKAAVFIRGFGLRAYRRPLTDAEVAQYVGLFNKGPTLIGSADAFADGVQLVVTLFLQSPHFLYRTELTSGPGAGGKLPLGEYEIASKLSFTLSETMPDDALFAAAANKSLLTREGVLAEAKRLLAAKPAQAMVDDFHYQLLHMAKYEFVAKDDKKFPDWKNLSPANLRTETQTFIKDVIFTQDKGLKELLTSTTSFINSKLAPFYGMQMPAAPAAGAPDPFVKVELDPVQRAGLLTQVGFLAAYADGREPSSILRGAFISSEIMCVDLPPPPDAFMLPPPMPGRTNRQRIEGVTGADGCKSCHQTLINPPGFSLENFDATGKFRTTDNSLPVDSAGTYSFDGEPKSFKGAVEFAKLAAATQQAHNCYAQNWLEFGLGRLIDKNKDPDKSLIAQLGLRSVKAGAGVKAMLLDIVTSDAFLTRLPGVAP